MFPGATLTVSADGADNVAITISGGNVKINGADPASGVLAASAVGTIDITATGDATPTPSSRARRGSRSD